MHKNKNIGIFHVGLIFLLLIANVFISCERNSAQTGIKVFIITDMEGVAGVANFEDWAYDTGK